MTDLERTSQELEGPKAREGVARNRTAGILILNWNGCDLLREHLPSVVVAAEHSRITVAVADNGSTDGSLGFLLSSYPQVLTIPLGANHGFGRGYNLAMRQVSWDVVILLNNDMAVDEDFAEHLIEPFCNDSSLFAVSSQVFFQDPNRRREETGRTSARLFRGQLQCAHVPVESDDALVPIFWLGGGSAAVSRDKFEQLGGFEELLSPFYMEDVDLSYRAWKRGWSTLLAPRSRVLHRHRGSTSRLDADYVERIIARNRLLFVWLNIRDRRMLAEHLRWLFFNALRRQNGRSTNVRALLSAARRLPSVLSHRRRMPRTDEPSDASIFAMFSGDWSNT
jgi:GT2 family glycosyltransferase